MFVRAVLGQVGRFEQPVLELPSFQVARRIKLDARRRSPVRLCRVPIRVVAERRKRRHRIVQAIVGNDVGVVNVRARPAALVVDRVRPGETAPGVLRQRASVGRGDLAVAERLRGKRRAPYFARVSVGRQNRWPEPADRAGESRRHKTNPVGIQANLLRVRIVDPSNLVPDTGSRGKVGDDRRVCVIGGERKTAAGLPFEDARAGREAVHGSDRLLARCASQPNPGGNGKARRGLQWRRRATGRGGNRRPAGASHHDGGAQNRQGAAKRRVGNRSA
jgi:hypothetical protein